MDTYSWDIDDCFYNLLLDFDLARGYHLVDICFEQYPKEPNCIIMIILEKLYHEATDMKRKLMLEALMDYYGFLLKK